MKFTAVLLLCTALFAAVFGAHPTPPRRCDFKCTELDKTVCGSNGVCLNSFPSQCQMKKYNCLFPKKAFAKVADWMCLEKSLSLCTLGDL